MSNKAKERAERLRKISEQVEDDFFKGMMTQPDAAFSLNYGLLPEEEDFIDPEFAPLASEDRAELGKAISDLAEKDEEMRAALQEYGIQDFSQPQPFRNGRWGGTYWREPDHWCFDVLNKSTGEAKRLRVYKFLNDAEGARVEASRMLQELSYGAHELTEQERLAVAYAAKQDIGNAIALYLGYRYPNVSEDEALSLLTDPRYQRELAAAVWFVFRLTAKNWSEADAVNAEKFMRGYIGSRPVTYDLLEEAHRAYLSDKSIRELSANHEQPAQPDFDNLSDEELTQTLDSATAAYVRAVRNQRH
jgi:hypothetical protein